MEHYGREARRWAVAGGPLSGRSSAPEGAKKTPLLPLNKPAKKACGKEQRLFFTGQGDSHEMPTSSCCARAGRYGYFLFCLRCRCPRRRWPWRWRRRPGGGSFGGGGSYGSVRQSGGYGSRPVNRPERPLSDSWENSRDMQRGQYGSVRQYAEDRGAAKPGGRTP